MGIYIYQLIMEVIQGAVDLKFHDTSCTSLISCFMRVRINNDEVIS